MTDPSAPAASDPQAAPIQPTAPQGGQSKSPLDVLDQILNDAQTKATETAAQQEEAEKNKLEEAAARQKEEDKQLLEQQIAELQHVKETPEYQARVQQIAEQSQAQAQHAEEMAGSEIRQIEHTKVDVPAE